MRRFAKTGRCKTTKSLLIFKLRGILFCHEGDEYRCYGFNNQIPVGYSHLRLHPFGNRRFPADR